MNLQKFTQKSLEAIQNAQSNAVEYGNPQLDQQHLLLALLQQEDGLIPGLLQKMNINVNGLTQAVENEVKRLPRVSGGETRVAVDLEKALTAAVHSGEHHIQLEMSGVDYISSAGLRVIFNLYNLIFYEVKLMFLWNKIELFVGDKMPYPNLESERLQE